MFSLSHDQIRVIRGRLIFTIGMTALYQPLITQARQSGFGIYIVAFVATLIAIWIPKGFRTAAYYVAAGLGALVLGAWLWTTTVTHAIPPDALIPAVVILGGAPKRFGQMSMGLVGAVVLMGVVGGAYPGSVWSGIAQVGIYGGVRSIRVRREMESTRLRYVQELENTLAELQAAQAKLETDAAQSMHYAAQAERFRIARDIHDGLGHQLTSLIVQLQALSYMIPGSLQDAHARVSKLVEVARTGLDEVRQSVRGWEEEAENYGLTALTAVVEEIKSTSHCHVDLHSEVNDGENWPVKIQIALYRVLQETLSNAVRHSNASHVEVQISEKPHQVTLTVSDNGTSALEEPLKPGFGLRNMRARCEELGGRCGWHVRHDGGVTVEVALPIQECAEVLQE